MTVEKILTIGQITASKCKMACPMRLQTPVLWVSILLTFLMSRLNWDTHQIAGRGCWKAEGQSLRIRLRGVIVCLCPDMSLWCWESQTAGAAQHRHGASEKENWPVACMGWSFRSVAFDTLSCSSQVLNFFKIKHYLGYTWWIMGKLIREQYSLVTPFLLKEIKKLAVYLCVAT